MREESKCFKTKSQSARCSVLLVCLLGAVSYCSIHREVQQWRKCSSNPTHVAFTECGNVALHAVAPESD
jgi:hypothetical protein